MLTEPSWRRLAGQILAGAAIFFAAAIALSLLLFPSLGLEDARFEVILWDEILRHPQETIEPLLEASVVLGLASVLFSVVTVSLSKPMRFFAAVVLWVTLLFRSLEHKSFLFHMKYSPGAWLSNLIREHNGARSLFENAILAQGFLAVVALWCCWGFLSDIVRSQERISAFRRRQVLRELDLEFKNLVLSNVALVLVIASAVFLIWAVGEPAVGRLPPAPSAPTKPNMVILALQPREHFGSRHLNARFLEEVSKKIGRAERISGSLRSVSSESLPRWFALLSGETPSNIGLWHDFPARSWSSPVTTILPAIVSGRGYVSGAVVSDESAFFRNFPFGFQKYSVEELASENILRGYLAGNVRAFAGIITLPRVCSWLSRWCFVSGEIGWKHRRQTVDEVIFEAASSQKAVMLLLRGGNSDYNNFLSFAVETLGRLKSERWLDKSVIAAIEESDDPKVDGRFAIWDARSSSDKGKGVAEKVSARDFDLAPTLAALADVPFPPALVDGADLLSVSGRGGGLFPRDCVLWTGWHVGGSRDLALQSDRGDYGRFVALPVNNARAFSRQRVVFSCGDEMISSGRNGLNSDWLSFRRVGQEWQQLQQDSPNFSDEFASVIRRRGFNLFPFAPSRWILLRGGEEL